RATPVATCLLPYLTQVRSTAHNGRRFFSAAGEKYLLLKGERFDQALVQSLCSRCAQGLQRALGGVLRSVSGAEHTAAGALESTPVVIAACIYAGASILQTFTDETRSQLLY
ncbi:MAG: hypothetical protein AAGI30_07080, partial [Planctomycetota bacterium]